MDERISLFQDLERAHRFKFADDVLLAGSTHVDDLTDDSSESIVLVSQAFVIACENLIGFCLFQSFADVIERNDLAFEQPMRFAKHVMSNQYFELTLFGRQSANHKTADPVVKRSNRKFQFALVGDGEFRRAGRRRSAQIGDVVRQRIVGFVTNGRNDGDGELRRAGRRRGAQIGDVVRQRIVGFVTDGGNDRDGGVQNRFQYDFFVERPQIFNRAAAASDNQDVGQAIDIGFFDLLFD